MRTDQHVIDTKAIKKVLAAFPDHWVVRELSERDYGIDLTVEIFKEAEPNRFGMTYVPTGAMCHIQVKGTRKPLAIESDSVKAKLPKQTMTYAEKFSTPVFLLRVCTDQDENDLFFVWLQRYVRDQLDIASPDWRERKKKYLAIKMPAANTRTELQRKVEKVALRPKYIEELAEFAETFRGVREFLNQAEETGQTDPHLQSAYIRKAMRFRSFHALQACNHCCVDAKSFEGLVSFLKSAPQHPLSDMPELHNLELLAGSVTSVLDIEDFQTDSDGLTAY